MTGVKGKVLGSSNVMKDQARLELPVVMHDIFPSQQHRGNQMVIN
jgi:hypothetical protein